jgi:hypothetical protein
VLRSQGPRSMQNTFDRVGQQGKETCPRPRQGQFFLFFAGMSAVTFDSAIGGHLDSTKRSWASAVQSLITCRERVRLRIDLGQSQPGNSSLSPQACRVENTTAELAISEILPITSARAPRYFGRRS